MTEKITASLTQCSPLLGSVNNPLLVFKVMTSTGNLSVKCPGFAHFLNSL